MKTRKKIKYKEDYSIISNQDFNLDFSEKGKFLQNEKRKNKNIKKETKSYNINIKKITFKSIIIVLLIIIFSNKQILYNLNNENIIIYYNHIFNIKEILKNRGNKIYLETNESLFWNNLEINLTSINEEIGNYENMIPTFNNKTELYKRKHPKVSLIIPVCNQEKFIERIYVTIEQQTLKDIEIVFIDDFSKDNSSKIIHNLMKNDKRIVYIQNKKNKGAFYSRNIGVLNARGEYVFCADVDDYIINDILIKSYITSITYDLDILQFYVMAGDFKNNMFWKVLKYKSGIIRSYQVMNVFLSGTTRNTWDKFVKRKTFIKSIRFMNYKFRSEKYVVYNDDVCIFGLIKVANSYGFLEEIGYIYNWAVPNSATHKYQDIKYTNEIFKSCFTIMEYFYEQTENDVEKYAGYNFFLEKILKFYEGYIQYLTEGFDYINKILDIYINSKFYTKSEKSKLEKFKKKIMNAKLNYIQTTKNIKN